MLAAWGAGVSARNIRAGTKAPASPYLQQTGFVKLPLTRKPVTLTILDAYQSPFKNGYKGVTMITRWEKQTHVHLAWNTVPVASWTDDLDTTMASGKLPDIIGDNEYGGGLTNTQLLQFAQEGAIVAINPYLKYMPRFRQILREYPTIRKEITAPNGKIYSFPTVVDINFGNRNDVLYFNKKMVQNAGYRGIKWRYAKGKYVDMATARYNMNQFYDLLVAIKKRYPNSIPFSAPPPAEGGLTELYGEFGLVDNSMHVVVEHGKVVFTANKPQWEQATAFFHKLYANKLMDPEIFTQGYNTFLAKIASNQIVSELIWTAQQEFPNMGSAAYYNQVEASPPTDPSGGYNFPWFPNLGVIPGTFTITAQNPHPKLSAEFMDYLYEPRNSIQLSIGPSPSHISFSKNGVVSEKNPPPKIGYVAWGGAFLNSMFALTGRMARYTHFSVPVIMTQDVGQNYRPYLSTAQLPYPNVTFSIQTSQKLSTLETNIENYVSKMQAQWITQGGVTKPSWNAYLRQLNHLGLSQYLSILQSNYNRYQRS